ncbi:MAG: zinc ribbon domain-containing protein [Peptococcaceae bacterium]|nr:zinc ribbon domain-containing protein [Peptococcaceae bacterium]
MMFKGLDKFVNATDFRKVSKWYIIVSLCLVIGTLAWGGYIFKDKIALTMNYHNIEEQAEKQGIDKSIQEQLGNLANSSADIKDVLLLDKDNNIIYSAKNSGLGKDNKLVLTKVNDKRQFFQDVNIPDTYFKVIGPRNVLLTKDVYRDSKDIKKEFDNDFFYDSNYNTQKIYFLNYFADRKNGMKVFIVNDLKPIPYAKVFIGFSAALLMLLFGLYWILVALWVYKDANRRKLNAPLWGLLILITNIVGLIVYTIYKQNNQTCYKCESLQNKHNTFCSYCGTRINKSCEKCGTIVTKNDTFCVHCGAKLDH